MCNYIKSFLVDVFHLFPGRGGGRFNVGGKKGCCKKIQVLKENDIFAK